MEPYAFKHSHPRPQIKTKKQNSTTRSFKVPSLHIVANPLKLTTALNSENENFLFIYLFFSLKQSFDVKLRPSHNYSKLNSTSPQTLCLLSPVRMIKPGWTCGKRRSRSVNSPSPQHWAAYRRTCSTSPGASVSFEWPQGGKLE